ncbi:MAG: hypothetical protein ACI91B_001827, partial [Planctomycetota bacterium]
LKVDQFQRFIMAWILLVLDESHIASVPQAALHFARARSSGSLLWGMRAWHTCCHGAVHATQQPRLATCHNACVKPAATPLPQTT